MKKEFAELWTRENVIQKDKDEEERA